MFKTLTSGFALAAGLITAGLIFAHGSNYTVYRTDPAPFGPATAESWITLDDHGRPIEIGVAFSEEGFAALSEHNDAALPLPPQAAATGIDHLYLT